MRSEEGEGGEKIEVTEGRGRRKKEGEKGDGGERGEMRRAQGREK